MLSKICLLLLPSIATGLVFAQDNSAKPEISVATQWLLDGVKSPAQKGVVKSVLMIVCRKDNKKGTGFALSGGDIVTTNSHVVGTCTAEELEATSSLGNAIKFTSLVRDENRDLALLCAAKSLPPGLPLAGDVNPPIETEIETWGYPLSYQDFAPILSRGYVAGYSQKTQKQENGTFGPPVRHLIINGAFNPGNSGGPLIDRNTGKIVGVVVTKCTLFSPLTHDVIRSLHNSRAKVNYFRSTDANGNLFEGSNEDAIAMALEEFYNSTQVMIGEAVSV